MFIAMEPKSAAQVLSRMADDDVRTILGALPERRAGEILSFLAPERAAAVSRGLLRPVAK
jgi:flagellar motility protein MotE (MotC chaperone)